MEKSLDKINSIILGLEIAICVNEFMIDEWNKNPEMYARLLKENKIAHEKLKEYKKKRDELLKH